MTASLHDQIAAAARELAMRRSAYPKWVKAGKLKPEKAEAEIAAMEAIVESVKLVGRLPQLLLDLRDGVVADWERGDPCLYGHQETIARVDAALAAMGLDPEGKALG